MTIIKFKKLNHFQGALPRYQSKEAAGMDVCAAISEPLTLKRFERALVPTGLSVEIPHGFEIQVRPRSGLAAKNGIIIPNSPGTIDSDYRGEIKVILLNLGESDFVVQPHDRIAQLVVAPIVQADIQEVQALTETERGLGGFGSTGLTR